jgi:flavin reductase (DIM6/NTAB) family NADH-FMN oxidoreductase RutF
MKCVLVNSVDFGTYDVLVALVERLEIGRLAPALTFWNGSFRVVRPSSSRDD